MTAIDQLGPTVLGVLQAVTFCSDDFEDEAGVWCSSVCRNAFVVVIETLIFNCQAGSTYWMVVVVLFATVHTIVVVTAPNSLRKYHQLDVRMPLVVSTWGWRIDCKPLSHRQERPLRVAFVIQRLSEAITASSTLQSMPFFFFFFFFSFVARS